MRDTRIFKSHHDEETAQLRARIAELEAELSIEQKENRRLKAELAAPRGGWIDQLRQRAERAEAALAERDRMLQLAYEMEELPAEWDPEGYAVWLADLRARAEEGSGDD